MKKISILILTIFAFSSCDQSESNCEDKVCTTQFVSVKVKFTDTDGKPLIVNDYQSVNLRTGSMLKFTGAVDPVNFKGDYTVAHDGNDNELEGIERIMVSAKHPVTKVLKQAEFKVSMEDCDCHISKLSGPEEIQF